MSNRSNVPDPSSPEVNPLGLGPRGRESSNTGSAADTSYDAYGSDPYTTDESGDEGREARQPALDASGGDPRTGAEPGLPPGAARDADAGERAAPREMPSEDNTDQRA